MHRGYIKLYRKIYDNQIWRERRTFSKAEAWIDILMQAQSDDKEITHLYGYKTIITKRGDCIKSLETWADRWHWSKTTVSRFFRVLSENGFIVYANETVTVRVSVCNYDLYQGTRNGNGTEVKRKRNASGTQVEPDKNDKKDKNDKNTDKKRYGEHVLLSDDEHSKLTIRFGSTTVESMIENMNLYAESKPKKFNEYVSHYATLLNWAKRDAKDKQQPLMTREPGTKIRIEI